MKKVKPGEPLAIPAAAFNAFVDAAEDFRRRQHDQSAAMQPASRQTSIVPLKNVSGADVGRFGILGIDGPLFDPAEAEDTFKNQVVFKGVTPAADTDAGRFAILLEPLADGQIGQAVIGD